jgi:hypothetical protein
MHSTSSDTVPRVSVDEIAQSPGSTTGSGTVLVVEVVAGAVEVVGAGSTTGSGSEPESSALISGVFAASATGSTRSPEEQELNTSPARTSSSRRSMRANAIDGVRARRFTVKQRAPGS